MVSLGEKSKLFDDKFLSPFYCKVCNFDGKSSEDSATHIESSDHAERVRILASSKTLVLWDINSCPVPAGCDASLVSPTIQRELEKSCFSGAPVKITAIGNLNPTLNEAPGVLPALASAGALLKHYPGGLEFIWGDLMLGTLPDPPPANTILLISSGFHEHFLRGCWALKKIGYVVKVESGVPLLQCLVKDNQATRGLVLQDTCSENEDV